MRFLRNLSAFFSKYFEKKYFEILAPKFEKPGI